MPMRKLVQWFLVSICTVLTLAGCQPNDAPIAASTPTSTPATTLSPLEWLSGQPFELVPSGFPDVILRDLPEGFEAEEPYDEMEDLPGGGQIQVTQVVYERRAPGDGSIVDNIEVLIMGYASLDDRTEHIGLLLQEGYQWSLEQYAGRQVARFQGYYLDGRIWVSGPYMIVVFGSTEGRSASVDAFTELYLDQPPAPGVGTLADWLSQQPFETSVEEWPDVPSVTLPLGFNAGDPSFESGELPSGAMVWMTTVTYFKEGEFGGSSAVYVLLYTCDSGEGRVELINLLTEGHDLPEERYNWRLEQRAAGEVAVYGWNGDDDGMVWISGPYFIVVSQEEPEYSDLASTIADLYLNAYPPE